MNKLRQFIFDYLRKKQPERQPRFPHLDQPLKIMLIYESDLLERNNLIKSFRQDLLRRQMDVTMWGYVEKKDIQTLILPQSRILGLADYNLWGKPRDYVVTDLKAEHYDLLIDLTTRPLLPLRYIAMLTDADFKVGLNLGEGIHDMLIGIENAEVKELYEQIMNYLTTIKSND
jgi:hypothetical protein